jgi:CRP-like cAMP-binding protein
MKATVEQLAKIGIFASLNQTELERLQEHTAIRTYRQGEVVMYEGDRIPEKLYTMIERFSAGCKNSDSGQRNNSGHFISGRYFCRTCFARQRHCPRNGDSRN